MRDGWSSCLLKLGSSLDFSRLHIKMDLSIFSQARRGVCKLSVIRGRGLGMSGHFRIIITRTGVQATVAVMQMK